MAARDTTREAVDRLLPSGLAGFFRANPTTSYRRMPQALAEATAIDGKPLGLLVHPKTVALWRAKTEQGESGDSSTAVDAHH